MLAQVTAQLEAVHARQPDVDDGGVDAALRGQGERLHAVGGSDRLVALAGEELLEEPAHARVVLHHQHPGHASPSLR